MKTEEAIRLLHPDTTAEAIAEIEYKNGFRGKDAAINKINKACKMACKALEKQIPKKPIEKNPICYIKSRDGEEVYAYDYHCPLCNARVNGEKHHCPCGQALDWSETEKGGESDA